MTKLGRDFPGWLAGGSGSPGAPRPLADQELIVAAAASLTNALKEVAGQFEKPIPAPGSSVISRPPGFCCSRWPRAPRWMSLPPRIEETMNRAEEKQLIVPGTRKNFVSNRLVLIAPGDVQAAPERSQGPGRARR